MNKIKKAGRPPAISTMNLPALAQEMLDFFYTAYNNLHTDKLPVFFTTFAIHKRLSKYDLHRYSKKHKEFGNAYMKCKEITEEILKIGLAKSYFSPGPGVFIAKNETEMRDKTEIEHGLTDPLMEAYKNIEGKDLVKKAEELAQAIIRNSGSNTA